MRAPTLRLSERPFVVSAVRYTAVQQPPPLQWLRAGCNLHVTIYLEEYSNDAFLSERTAALPVKVITDPFSELELVS